MTDVLYRLLGRLRQVRLAGSAWLLMVAFGSAGTLNLLFQVVSARLLTPAEFGFLGVMLVVQTVATVPAGSYQTLVAAATTAAVGAPPATGAARSSVLAEVDLRPALSSALRQSAVIGCLLMLTAPALTAAFGVSVGVAVLSGWLVAVTVPAMAVTYVCRGVLSAASTLVPVAAGSVVGPVVRVVCAVVGLVLFGQVWVALAAVAAGELVQAALLWCRVRCALTGAGARSAVRVSATASAAASSALLGFWLLTGADTVVAGVLLEPVQAGLYVAAVSLSRAALFLPQAVAMAAAPRLAGADVRGAVRALGRALMLVVGLCALPVAAVAAFPELVVGQMFGREYLAASSTVLLLVLVGSGLAVLSLLHTFLLMRRSRWVNGVWLALTVPAAMLLWPVADPSLRHPAVGAAAAVVLAVLAVSVGVLRVWREQRVLPGQDRPTA